MTVVLRNAIILIVFSIPFFYYLIPNLTESYQILSLNSKLEPILQSFIASIIFLIFVFLLIKPSIVISDSIANIPKPPTDKSPLNSHYRFKLVNYSFFIAYDILVFIYHVERVSLSGNDIKRTLLAKIQGPDVGSPYLQSAFLSLFDPSRPNAWQLRTNEQIEDSKIHDSMIGNSSVELHITVRHGLSGLQGTFIKEYPNENCIKNGYFSHGFSTSMSKP